MKMNSEKIEFVRSVLLTTIDTSPSEFHAQKCIEAIDVLDSIYDELKKHRLKTIKEIWNSRCEHPSAAPDRQIFDDSYVDGVPRFIDEETTEKLPFDQTPSCRDVGQAS